MIPIKNKEDAKYLMDVLGKDPKIVKAFDKYKVTRLHKRNIINSQKASRLISMIDSPDSENGVLASTIIDSLDGE